MSTIESPIPEALALLRQAVALLEASQGAPSSPAVSEPAELARIEKVGHMAHLHLEFIEANGSTMTVADSRELRHAHYGHGDKMRATANLFGRRDSGAILYRPVPFGTRTKATHEVRLTEEGTRLAHAYRQLHGLV